MRARRFARPYRRAPKTAGRVNKTEARYAERLAQLQAAGEITAYRYEAIKLRLADNTFYTPDFLVTCHEHIELHEVKGHWEDDARVKIKVAAEQFPQFRFIAVTEGKGGTWNIEEF